MGFERDHCVEEAIELAELGLAQFALHPRVVRFDGVRQLLDELAPLGGGFDDGAALVLRVALAAHEPVTLHAREHARQARPQDEGLARDAAGFHRAVFAQHAQNAPLLVRQAVTAQAGPRVRHHGLARLQQQARQIAVREGGGGHGEAN